MAFLSHLDLQESLQTLSVLQWIPVYVFLGEWTPGVGEHKGTDEERDQESPDEEGSKEIIWLVTLSGKDCASPPREIATVEFIRFLSSHLRGMKAMSEAAGFLI